MALEYLSKAGLTLVLSKIKGALALKVDKAEGMGLTHNDFTDEYKTKVDTYAEKVDGIVETGGEPNKIDTVKVNGTELAIADKSVNIVVPTTEEINTAIETATADFQTAEQVNTAIETATADFQTADDVTAAITTATADFQTADDVNTAVTTAVAEAMEDVTGVDFQTVDALPATGAAGTIYLVPNSGTGTNTHDEYIYVNGAFEKIGSTDVDLSDYQKKSEVTEISTEEINTLWGE